MQRCVICGIRLAAGAKCFDCLGEPLPDQPPQRPARRTDRRKASYP